MELLKSIKSENVYAIDIETVSIVDKFEDASDVIKKAWSYKMEYENKDGILNDSQLWELKSSLYPEFSKICAVSICFLNKKQDKLVCKSHKNYDEVELLNDVSFMLNAIENSDSDNRLIGHTAKSYDFPFLCKRFIINGLPIPKILDTAHLKPWESKNLCLNNDIWKMGGTGSGATLLSMCACLGIEISKDSIDGGDVKKYYYDNKLDEISTYCGKDTIATYNLFRKIKGESTFMFNDVKYI